VAERCDGDAIPRVDASPVNQRDELVVCLLLSGCRATDTKASRVSIPAVRHRRDAITARKLKKAARRIFFIFMTEDLRETSHKTAYLAVCETPNEFRFRAISRVYVL
jgi:hypothetical protein